MKDQAQHTPAPQKFNWFPNHGDEDGNNGYTIIYGEDEDIDHVIVGCEDSEDDATEACKRLNEITSGLLAENVRLKEEVEGLQKDKALLDSLYETAKKNFIRVGKEAATLREQNKELIEALRPMVKYWEWVRKDPQFEEYRRAVAALSKGVSTKEDTK